MICWDVSSKSRKVRAPITKVSCSHDEIDELKAILPYKKKINETDAETLWQKRLAKFDSTTTPVWRIRNLSWKPFLLRGNIYMATSLCLSEQMKSEVRGWRVGVCDIVSCGTRGQMPLEEKIASPDTSAFKVPVWIVKIRALSRKNSPTCHFDGCWMLLNMPRPAT